MQKHHKNKEKKGKLHSLFRKETVKASLVALALTLLFSSVHYSTTGLQTNLIYKNAEQIVFDGTVKPLPKTVNWQKLPQEYWQSTFDQVPEQYKEELTNYVPADLAIPIPQLDFSDSRRNAKITYPVPYLGSYELNGKENVGSHLAIDIKALSGTPIVTVANGVVTKVSLGNSNFGNSVVILYPNVPDLDQPEKAVNYFASYSHMARVDVSEGDTLTKGQQIGVVGNTGFATTNHVHFQIDREEAPWHPYWPFTTTEATNKGLDFVGAVNAGLGIDVARKLTINPMQWVQKWLGGTNGVVLKPIETSNSTLKPTLTNENATIKPIELPETVTIPVNDIVESPVIEIKNEDNFSGTSLEQVNSVNDLDLKIELVGEPLIVGKDAKLKLKLIKPNGEDYSFSYKFLSDPLKISVSGSDVDFVDGLLKASNFENGISELTFTPKSAGKVKFSIENSVFSLKSNAYNVEPFVDVKAASEDGKLLSFLLNEGVISGYSDKTYKPDQAVARVEALKLVLEATKAKSGRNVKQVAYLDTDVSSWYSGYVALGQSLGVIEQNNDRLLRPYDQVNLAEFLKMIFKSLKVDLDLTIDEGQVWYTPYLHEALQMGLVTLKESENVDQGLTRIETARILYRLKKRLAN